MCGRFVQACSTDDLLALCDALDLDFAELEPDYNVSPGKDILAVAPGSGREHGCRMRWGIPRDAGKGVCINTRSETMTHNPFFQHALSTGRCLIPASGFYEWEQRAGSKQPWYFSLQNEAMFCFAGLAVQTEDCTCCTIITTRANADVGKVHSRMPAILSRGCYETWLTGGEVNEGFIDQIIKPWPDEKMMSYPVSAKINRVTENGPDCIRPIDISTQPVQLNLL